MTDQTTISGLDQAVDEIAQLKNPLIQAIARVPLADPRYPYQSRIFIAKQDINPLIASAAVLLSLMGKLTQTDHYTSLSQLQQELIYEIHAFESNAQQHHYRAESILIARYVLSATLDEIINQTSWGNQAWVPFSILTALHGEIWSGERFYLILERLSEDPKVHIDVLELMYLCLSLGFEGKFRHLNRGSVEHNRVLDRLYQSIRHHRGELDKRLHFIRHEHHRPKKRKVISLWLVASVTICLIAGTYGIFEYVYQLDKHFIQTLIANPVASDEETHHD